MTSPVGKPQSQWAVSALCDSDLITALMFRGGNAFVRAQPRVDPFVDNEAIRINYDAAVSRHSNAIRAAASLSAVAANANAIAGVYEQSAANAASNLNTVQYTLLNSSSNLASLTSAYASTLAGGTIATQQADLAMEQKFKASQFLAAAQASNAVAAATLSNSQSAAAQAGAAVKAAQNEVTNATVAANVTKTKAAKDRENATNAINLYHTTIRQNRWYGYDYRIYERAVEANASANASTQAAIVANATLVAANGNLHMAQAATIVAAKALAAAQVAAKDAAANLFATQTMHALANKDAADKTEAANTLAARTNIIKSAIDATTTVNNNAIMAAPLAVASASNAGNAYLQRQQTAIVVNGIASVARVASGNLDVVSLGALLAR